MLYAFCPRTIRATSVGFCRNRPESSPDKMYRACEQKDQIFKKIRTLHLNIHIQYNAGTACVLKALACRGLRAGRSIKVRAKRDPSHELSCTE